MPLSLAKLREKRARADLSRFLPLPTTIIGDWINILAGTVYPPVNKRDRMDSVKRYQLQAGSPILSAGLNLHTRH
jgi:hypothetical protein